MQNTVLDYIDFRGDLTIDQYPYNEIDFLIFSQIAYMDFDSFIDDSFTQRSTIYEIYSMMQKYPIDVPKDNVLAIFEKMTQSNRYKNIKIIAFINKIDNTVIKQFSAIAFLLEDESLIISYRGTDETLTGWHENFFMFSKPTIPSQEEALLFLQKGANYQNQKTLREALKSPYLGKSLLDRIKKYYDYKKNRPIILTGHSKGGNLAMYAGFFADKTIQDRITNIYCFDSPGFTESALQSAHYSEMLPKIHHFIPQYSLFGRMLEHKEEYHVIHSHNIGLNQHNVFSWEVDAFHILSDELDQDCLLLSNKVCSLFEDLDKEQCDNLIEAIFSIFSSLKLNNINDLFNISYVQMLTAIKEMLSLDSKIRRTLFELANVLWLEIEKTK